MDKILTLIIPTYNMEKYLDKCLTSLVISDSKLMKLLEVLVIIDGATDRSSEMAHGYETKYPDTFRVIDKENGNYGSCINRGLKEATGKYIKVLDADDWFDTEVFESVLSFLQNRDEDVILSSFNIVDESGITKWTWALNKQNGETLHIDDIRPQNMSMHAVMHKTNNLRAINYKQKEGISYTDTEWFYLPIAYSQTFVYFDKPLYQYLVGRKGQTVDGLTVSKKIDQVIIIAERMIQQYSTIHVEEIYRHYMHGCIERILEYIYRMILNEGDCQYNVDKLARFDKKLQNTEFYEILDKYTYRGLEYHYISDWRKSGYPQKLSSKKIYYYSKKKGIKEKFSRLKLKIKKLPK